MFKEFKEFIAKGNVIDLAVAVIIGAGNLQSSLRVARPRSNPWVQRGTPWIASPRSQ